MQMYTVAARHIVLVARVDEEVRIRAGIDARFHKREGVLRHAGVVVVIVDDHQMSFQVACQVFQVTLFISSRIALRGIHIAFSVHHFVIPPVNDGTAGHAHFKYLGIAKEEGSGHVTAKAPAVYSDTVPIDVGEAFQEFGSFHLVSSFFDSQLAESNILKIEPPIAASTSVYGKHDVTFVGHIDIPASCTVLPAVGDQLCVRTAVYVYDSRVFLVRIEIGRFY